MPIHTSDSGQSHHWDWLQGMPSNCKSEVVQPLVWIAIRVDVLYLQPVSEGILQPAHVGDCCVIGGDKGACGPLRFAVFLAQAEVQPSPPAADAGNVHSFCCTNTLQDPEQQLVSL